MKVEFLLNNISECNTCVKCGILCKYGIESHLCSKDPCMQQSRKSFQGNKNVIKGRKFVHSRGRKYKCSICPFATKYKSSLHVHELRHLLESEREFKCSLCLYATNYKGSLKAYQLIHSGDCRLKRSTCSFATNNKRYLEIHE